MALNKKETAKGTKAVAPKGATKKPEKKPNSQSALAMAGKGRYKEMSVDEQAKLGSKSKDVAFLNLIGNPYNKVPRGDDKGSESIGLLLKNVGEEPITYLKFKQKSKAVMDADYAHPTQKVAQPGEEFILTWAEAGAFAVRDEFNGFILGNEDEGKRLRYTPNSNKGKGIPTTKFILVGANKGSISDFCIDIATPEEMKERKVSPQYEEDFKVFAIAQRANSGVSMKREGLQVNAAALAVNAAFAQLIGQGGEEEATETPTEA